MKSYYQFPINNPELEILHRYNGNDFVNFIEYITTNNLKFIEKTVGNNKLCKNEVKKEICSCKKLTYSINLYFKKNVFHKIAEFLEEPETENFLYNDKYYDLLKYEKGDFFKEHQDSKYNEYHIGTILIYPPKKESNYEGGELYLPKENITIKAFDNEWSIVILHINTLHEVKPITSGIRYVFKQKFIINDNVKILLENKLCENIKLNEDKIENIKRKEELEIVIKHQEDILTNLKKEKYILDNIDRCDAMVNDIINELNNGGIKIVCQNYYENPILDKLTGLDKNVISQIHKKIGTNINIRMFNNDSQIKIISTSSKIDSLSNLKNIFNQKIDLNDYDFEYIPFEEYETFRISYDNILTGNYQGISSKYNDYEYENYYKIKISVIIIKMNKVN